MHELVNSDAMTILEELADDLAEIAADLGCSPQRAALMLLTQETDTAEPPED